MSDFGGDWSKYVEEMYRIFKRDFTDSCPSFLGKPVVHKRYPIDKDKEAAFWHLISAGETEADRVPDLARCQRIRWPRAMIDAVGSEKVAWWENTRGTERRFVVALPDFSYVVVLAEKKGQINLWTAYCVENEHRRRKLRREWERSR